MMVRMATWDTATIDRVERLYVKVDVAIDVQGRPGTADAIAHRLTSVLRTEAHALAVEIHPDDVQVHRGAEDENRLTVEYVGHWQPCTGRCELRGGALDGTMYETRLSRHEPLQVPAYTPSLSVADPGDVSTSTAFTLGIYEYDVIGWSEEGRHWVRAIHDTPGS